MTTSTSSILAVVHSIFYINCLILTIFKPPE